MSFMLAIVPLELIILHIKLLVKKRRGSKIILGQGVDQADLLPWKAIPRTPLF